MPYKQASIILTITTVVVLISAALIPSEYYFEQRKNIPTDPVAVFEFLEDYTENEQWYQDFGLDNVSMLKIINTEAVEPDLVERESEPYKEISLFYDISNDSQIEFGFLLEPNPDGTILTCYIQRSDLAYPFEKLGSLFIPLVMRNHFQKALENIYIDLVE